MHCLHKSVKFNIETIWTYRLNCWIWISLKALTYISLPEAIGGIIAVIKLNSKAVDSKE